MEKLFNCFASFLNVHFFLFITITTIFTLPQRNITAQVAPGDPAAVPVEFRFFHNLAPTDSGVGINGTMNGWKEVYKMKQVQPGLWKAILELLPVSYDYKFVTYRDTTSQTGVTGYFTDPLNSLSGGPFGNSILKVKSPFIYYFLPVDQSEVNIDMPEISAKIAVANSAQLDLNKLVFKIDGIIIPNAMNYFNDVTKDFSYKPEEPLSMDTHTAYLKAFTTSGDSSELTISFTLRGHASVAPFTFQFDSKSPNFNFLSPVEKVDIKSTFNKEGMNSMSDADSDGVYTYTTNLRYNLPVEYTYIINGGAYINDPDNPLLSSKHRSMIIKTKNLNSYFTGFSPATARIYTLPKETFTIKGHINAADSAQIFNVSSLKANLDGTSIPVKIIRNNTDVDFEVTVTNPTEGRHIINFSGADIYGTQTIPFSYVFAVYPAGKGFHYIDGEKDDKGTGTFKYPATIADGCADIREVNITPTSGLDSLRFSIKMRKISENTRLGLVIINKLDASYVEAPKDVNIKIPEWNNRGVLALVGTQSPLLDKSENVIYGSRLPSMNFIDTISPDLPYLQQNEFRFTIAISVLENIMGTFKEKWYFGLYSYLKDQNGTVKVTADLGGKDIPENPNLYDLAFFNDQNIQFRLLSNFSSSSQIGGPALSVIGSDQRGFLAISPAEIDPQLGQAPAIKLLAGGGELLRDTVTIAGLADIGAGSDVTLNVNGVATTTKVNSNHEFSTQVKLSEGINKIFASIPLSGGKFSKSLPIVYTVTKDHAPVIKTSVKVSGGNVIMDAGSTVDPDGTSLSFAWAADPQNPQKVSLFGASSAITSFPLPQKQGEYYFTVTVKNSSQKTAWARTVLVVNDSGSVSPNMASWHPAWVDSAIIYSVFVRTFSNAGTFKAITERMQEIKDLGVNCIWFLPIHPTTGNLGPDNPGYAITDYMNLLQQYGTKEDFKTLVETAHQNGIKIVMDHVIQHTSDLHPFMRDAIKYKQHSPYYPFYMWDNNGNFQYLFTWVDLPSINYEEQSTRDYLLRMAKYWMQDFNIDGYRCDVAHQIIDLRPSGPAYFEKWRAELKAMKPDSYFLAEADAKGLQYLDKKFDAAYDWTLFSDIKNLISGVGSVEALNNTITSYMSPSYPKNARPFRFLENQDEQRFIEAFGIANTRTAASLLLTLPGIPMLYAGQEVGEQTNRGNIKWNDPYNLRPFYKKLIDIRKHNQAITQGDFLSLSTRGKDFYSYLRTSGNNNVIVNLNFSSIQQMANITVPLQKLAFDSTSSFYLNDLLNGTSVKIKGTDLKSYQVTLQPNSAQIFVLSDTQILAVDEQTTIKPENFSIAQNYPNPFNPSTTIRYQVPAQSIVNINVYNVLGQKVAELVNKIQSAGYYDTVWNAERLASGLYIYTIEARPVNGGKEFRMAKKMMMVK